MAHNKLWLQSGQGLVPQQLVFNCYYQLASVVTNNKSNPHIRAFRTIVVKHRETAQQPSPRAGFFMQVKAWALRECRQKATGSSKAAAALLAQGSHSRTMLARHSNRQRSIQCFSCALQRASRPFALPVPTYWLCVGNQRGNATTRGGARCSCRTCPTRRRAHSI